MLKRTCLSVLLLCLAFVSFAQKTGTIKGFVYERATGEPMIFVNVLLEGTTVGVQTDVNGYFSIQAPEGTHTLFTTIIGYDTAKTTVTIKAGDIVTKKLFVGTRQNELKGVEISARKTEKVTQINAGVTTITPREMKLLPSAGGEPDVAQFLQVVPGVVFTGDQGGQLYIRGGSPTQTGILLDGVTIYNPFHSIGLYSVFETDAIRNVDVYSAGFNAQYGNRTSAIVDIRTKDGNKNRLAGKISVSPIMARAMLEGPLKKPKTEGGSGITFMLSAKHSYLDQTSKSIYGGAFGQPFESGLPYGFTDLYGKITFSGENGSKLNLFGFNFDDKAKIFKPNTDSSRGDFSWKARGGGATFVVTPGSSSALISGRFAISRYDISLFDPNYLPSAGSTGGGRTRSSSIDGFESGIEFTYFLPKYSQLKYGIEVSDQHTALTYFTEVGTPTELNRRNTLGALYLMYRKNFGEKLVFEPSFRLQYYAASSDISPEPRLGLKYNISNNVRLKFATGMYAQNIISTKSDRDIVNFFTGFILSPDERIYDTKGKMATSNLQRAYHALGGIEVDIQDVELNLEPWYKNFNQNVELSRIKYLASDPNFTSGFGKAYGVDFSAKYNKNRWYLWGVVSYQKIEYTTTVLEKNIVTLNDNGSLGGKTLSQAFPPPFDRRMNSNMLVAYTAGKNKDWELSARFNYGSPFPFTQTQGFYEQLNPTQGATTNTVATQNGSIGLLYSTTINGGRLSHYHRMDLSARKKFSLSETSNIEATFSVSNIYNRDNIFYVDRTENTRVYQLPIFPSINVTWNF
ncbi:MAG: TonB-dependent receptor [Sphingobacteriales bacterium]|nr:MAG: TonB-dependent receptor [Sphingobacteriales bacterium]